MPRQEIAKVEAKGAYSQSVEDVFIKHDGHYFKFCILRSESLYACVRLFTSRPTTGM